MAAARERLPPTGPATHAPPRRAPRRRTLAADVLALQRTAGNYATRMALARQKGGVTQPAPAPQRPAPSTATFTLLVVDDGTTGLDAATLKAALDIVRNTLKTVTAASTDPRVKAGFDVKTVTSIPRGKPRDLGVRSFIVYLMAGQDAKRAWELAEAHIDLDHRERKTKEAHFKKQLEVEGGVNSEWLPRDPRKPSKSVAIVSTERPAKMQADKKKGPKMAGALLGDVILHELGHATGAEHDTGLMSAARIIDSVGNYGHESFSATSSAAIRARLENLAQRTPPPP